MCKLTPLYIANFLKMSHLLSYQKIKQCKRVPLQCITKCISHIKLSYHSHVLKLFTKVIIVYFAHSRVLILLLSIAQPWPFGVLFCKVHCANKHIKFIPSKHSYFILYLITGLTIYSLNIYMYLPTIKEMGHTHIN